MNRVKLTVSDESGKTLCKIGTSIDDPAGLEYTDAELADALTGMAYTLNEAHKHRSDALTAKWAAVLGAESSTNKTAMLLEAQETPFFPPGNC
jgi:hypothetical protein